jgi:hypothetical protein
MSFFYWLSLALGGGAFLLSLLGSFFDAHGHFAHDTHIHSDDFDWGRIFSIRNLTYLLFGFGATGVLLSLIWRGERDLLVAVLAGLTGASAWMISALLFGYLRQSESGERPTDRTLIGRVGYVTLPLRRGGTGKVQVTRGGQTQELLARPMNDDDANAEQWESVVVVEMRDGIALVTPYTEETQS